MHVFISTVNANVLVIIVCNYDKITPNVDHNTYLLTKSQKAGGGRLCFTNKLVNTITNIISYVIICPRNSALLFDIK